MEKMKILSMTGFGRSMIESCAGRIIVEVTTVNRKYLEINLLTPRELSRFEIEIRKWIGEKIARGFVTLRIQLLLNEQMLSELLPDIELLKRLKKEWVQAAHELSINPNEITLSFLLASLPPTSAHFLKEEEACMKSAKDAVEKALDECVLMRKKEGKVLISDIKNRLDLLTKYVHEIQMIAPESVAAQRQKLRESLHEVLESSLGLDERIMQESAILAVRIDISEEIVRLLSHLTQFNEFINIGSSPIGRKMEFLVQEMLREINTIGSKSIESSIIRLVVESKTELEKIREQIQNIE